MSRFRFESTLAQLSAHQSGPGASKLLRNII